MTPSFPRTGVSGHAGAVHKLEAVDQFTPDEQEHVAAFIEGALLRHHARQALSGRAS